MFSTQAVIFLVVFLATIVTGPILLPVLKKLKLRQTIRDNGPKSHLSKMGTPTMGGLIFLIPVFVAGMMYANYDNRIVSLVLLTAGFALVGFLDDFIKVWKKSKDGLSANQKMLGLLVISAIFATYISMSDIGTSIIIPFFAFERTIDLGIFYIPFTMIVLVGTSNAVNITDGLDGLATGTTFFASLFLAMIAMTSLEFEYINFFAVALCGGTLGFLLYNFYPAKLFMGDTGSLALGGAISAIAIVMRLHLILLVLGGIFVLEAFSVIIQVVSFKLTKKRVFKMAPLHHHFELSGWKETNIVYLFWSVTIILGVLALLFLRINLLEVLF